MKYLIALSAALALVLGGSVPAGAGTGDLNFGCHAVYSTPPGGGEPVIVEVCP